MSEILAPAGDEKCALAAINAGANAIYLGLKQFSARSFAENFDDAVFESIVKRAHALGVKVYVAMNTLVKESEVENFIVSAVKAWNLGADAIIISDLFLGKFIKKNYPEIVLHLSTQAGVCNSLGAKAAKEAGFSRVILARETAFEDIEEIAKIIETEVFIQGALCTCFSGQCYLSSYAGGNSGNRGKCKQPCRKKYSLDRDGFEEMAYRLSLSDLSVGTEIKKLIEAGVFSFKIEGRMRRPEYVSAAVKYYRNILDFNEGPSDLSDLKRTFNRGNYTSGLAFGQDKRFLSSAVQGHVGEFVGVIKVLNGKYLCQSPSKFNVGDGFKILRDGREIGGGAFVKNVGGGFIISSNARLKNGDKAFITTDCALNERLLNGSLKINLSISAYFKVGRKPEITVNGKTYLGETELSEAKNMPVTKNDILACFQKVDKYPFNPIFSTIECDAVFVPTSELNALRRKIYMEYYDEISKNSNVIYSLNHNLPELCSGKSKKVAVISTNLCGITADIGILKLNSFGDDFPVLLKNFKGEAYLYLPPYMKGSEVERVKQLAADFDGIYCNGIYGFALSKILGKPLFVGTGLNISNPIDLYECDAKYVALSKELTLSEADALSSCNTFYLTCGDVQVMDLIYCPFEKTCKKCDKRNLYTLTDENSRRFPVRRYEAEGCRFEVYNCANLVSDRSHSGSLLDLSVEKNAAKIADAFAAGEDLSKFFKNRTRGHSSSPIS